jgi:arginase
MGPSALRIAGIEPQLRALGYPVFDQGDIPVDICERQAMGDDKLRFMGEIVRAATALCNQVEHSLDNRRLPLCLGGDHSTAIGSIAGASAHCRRHGRSFGVVWIDAHPDFNTRETTPSGNIHGMAAAAVMGIGHPDLVGVGGYVPMVQAGHVVMVGVRNVDREEREALRRQGVTVFTMSDIDRLGIARTGERMLAGLDGISHLHVSFDMDGVDPGTAPGVGTPVAGGLTFREAHYLMECIAESGRLASMDLVEVNPILDSGNRSAELAADLVASCLGKRIL